MRPTGSRACLSPARRGFCCHAGRVAQVILTLPAHQGGTVCALRVFGSCPFRTVEIQELTDNPGAPASTQLDVIVDWAREALLECRHEPTWLEYWPQRALLAVVRGDAVSARNRLWRLQDDWVRVPLPRAEYTRLVTRSLAPASRRHASGGGSQPW